MFGGNILTGQFRSPIVQCTQAFLASAKIKKTVRGATQEYKSADEALKC
jgi:hypothetical protein